jgi:hypothetical protein
MTTISSCFFHDSGICEYLIYANILLTVTLPDDHLSIVAFMYGCELLMNYKALCNLFVNVDIYLSYFMPVGLLQ